MCEWKEPSYSFQKGQIDFLMTRLYDQLLSVGPYFPQNSQGCQ